MADIFDFYDYHKYLRRYYEERKAIDPNFSYRYIQQKVGIDPGYLVKIFQGQKEISLKYVPALAKLLQLESRETEYLKLMVQFSRAKKNNDIKHYFEKMLEFLEFDKKRVDTDKYEFYQKWYYTAVREAIGIYPFKDDYTALGKLLNPQITAAQAKKAIELLERLEFIKRKPKDGTWEVTSRFISTGEEWTGIAVRTYQDETLKLAQRALQEIPKQERDISTVTMTLSPKGFSKARECLTKFRKELLDIAYSDIDVSRSYQVNLSLFPITTKEGGKK